MNDSEQLINDCREAKAKGYKDIDYVDLDDGSVVTIKTLNLDEGEGIIERADIGDLVNLADSKKGYLVEVTDQADGGYIGRHFGEGNGTLIFFEQDNIIEIAKPLKQ